MGWHNNLDRNFLREKKEEWFSADITISLDTGPYKIRTNNGDWPMAKLG